MSESEFLRAVDHVAKMNDLNGTEKRALRASVRRQEMDERHSLIQEPIRCFDGNAKPHEPFWALHNATETETGEPEVEFYGPISEFLWMGDEITPKIFKDDLYRLGGKGPVTVRVNSPGGDLIASSVIRAIMLDYPGRITVKIDGLAASAAVMVALGGDRILIQQSAYMMVHDPMIMLFMAALNINDLAELLTELKTVKRGIVEAYTAKTQLPPEKVAKLMSDETWMTAGDAVALGFADEVIGGVSKPVNFVNALQKFNHVPPALLERIGAVDPIPDVDDEKARQLQQLRDEIKLII
jgi:ATP-dependent Clp protease protease subunit